MTRGQHEWFRWNRNVQLTVYVRFDDEKCGSPHEAKRPAVVIEDQ